MIDFEILGVWLSAALMLAMFSFLYADNPFFKVAENFFIGVSVGYVIIVSYYDTLLKKFWNPLTDQGQWWVLIPAAMGLLLLTRYLPRGQWLARWTFAAVMGWTAGVAIPRTISQELQAQIKDTITPLISPEGTFGVTQLNAVVILVGVLAVLTHFFFSVEHRGPIKVTARVGVLYLMIAFGAGFGSTTMGRMSLLYDRTRALQIAGRAENYYATPILLAGIIVGLVIWRQLEARLLKRTPPVSPE